MQGQPPPAVRSSKAPLPWPLKTAGTISLLHNAQIPARVFEEQMSRIGSFLI
jgi:hypothetical protein